MVITKVCGLWRGVRIGAGNWGQTRKFPVSRAHSGRARFKQTTKAPLSAAYISI